MRVVTKCGKVQPAASAEQYLRMVCDELAYLEKRLREQAYSARCPKLQVVATGELVDYEGFHWEVMDEDGGPDPFEYREEPPYSEYTLEADELSYLKCVWPPGTGCSYWRRFQVMPPFTDPACHDAYDARRRAVRMSRDAAEAVIKYPTL
jgi:hypothetical protein